MAKVKADIIAVILNIFICLPLFGELMKRILSLVAVLAMSTALHASKYDRSLIAIEGGQVDSTLDTQTISGTTSTTSSTDMKGGFGALKIGAESENFRIFISGRYHDLAEVDLAISGGVEFQFLGRIGDHFNIFIGANGGYAHFEVPDATNGTQRFGAGYYGGDAGVNIDFTDNFGLELGYKLMMLDAQQTAGSNTYKINNLNNAYVSFIYKYQIK